MNKSYLSSAEHRARVILDAYGSRPLAWPDAERQATLDCIAHSPILQHYRSQLSALDDRIDAAQSDAISMHSDISALQQRILSRLPTQTREPVKNTTNQRGPVISDWLRSPRFATVMASVLLLVFLMMQHHIASGPHSPVVPASASFAAWTWYDITGQNLPAKQSSSSLTMTDLIDMDINQDGS